MKVWVTRDMDGFGTIVTWGRKPFDTMDDDGCWYDTIDPIDEDRNAKNFRKNFGFTPRNGSCKQYELSLKEIK